jgi:hypothetical protein
MPNKPADELTRLLAVREAAEAFLARISNITSAEFAVAAERPEREALRRALDASYAR